MNTKEAVMPKSVLERMVAAGIRLVHSVNCVVPEIPEVQDVLFALRVSEEEKFYWFCSSNHEPYIGNVHLVAAAVGTEVLMARPYDEQATRLAIAKAILALYPEHASCLASTRYTKVMELAGEVVPTGDELKRRLRTCECENCRERNSFADGYEEWQEPCYDLRGAHF
jgi:hypothetical protein